MLPYNNNNYGLTRVECDLHLGECRIDHPECMKYKTPTPNEDNK